MEEELRIATVMNGGVSLAVWIGGVTLEIGRLVARDSAYGELQELTSTRTRVDVICGTSAGGINGAFLAMAMAHHTRDDLAGKLAILRELWVTKGSITNLLHDPFSKDLRSFLDGDGFFYQSLREAFEALKGPTPTRCADVPIDLVITSTLLRGIRRRFADESGGQLVDVNHRGRFQFSRGPRQDADPFVDSAIVDQLALAARSTSSFPAAFEPSFCPVGEGTESPARPDMKGIANFNASRFVIDGGVLNNSPLDLALDRIFHQRAEGPVRRVLAYVIPDPGATAGDGPDGDIADKPDKVAEPPELLEVAIASLIQIPSVQSISAQLEELRKHNERVRERRNARILLTQYNKPPEIDALAAMLFEAYRAQRTSEAVDYIVAEIGRGLVDIGRHGLGHRGRREWLRRSISAAQNGLPWVPTARPDMPEAADETTIEHWRWGTRPVEHLARVLLDIVIRTQRLAVFARVTHGLGTIWDGAFEILEGTERIRDIDRTYWRRQAEQVEAVLGDGGRNVDDTAHAWLMGAITGWQSTPFKDPEGGDPLSAYQASGRLLYRIAENFLALQPTVAAVCTANETSPDELVREQARDLAALYGYFLRDTADNIQTVVARLLSFEITQEALGGRGTLTEQELEFIQISARNTSTFGGPVEPAHKLAGIQLAHFGAFYKTSWRANDWLWGRRDAVQRLVRLVLDPERLRVAAQMKFKPGLRARCTAEAITRIAVETRDVELRAMLEKGINSAALQAELAYLDDPRIIVPEQLPISLKAISQRIESEILMEELPLLADAMEIDSKDRNQMSEGAKAFLARCRSASPNRRPQPDQLGALLLACEVGKERLESEIGSDRLTSMATQSMAIAMSSVPSRKGWLAFPTKVLTVLRAPTLLFYVFARNMAQGFTTGAAVNIAMLAAGALVIATEFFKRGTYQPWVLALGLAGVIAPLLWGALMWPQFVRKLIAATTAIALACVLGFFLGIVPLPALTVATWQTIAISASALFLFMLLGKAW